METRPYLLEASKASLLRPSVLLKTRTPRASSIRTPVLLMAPVAESVFEPRERLAVKYWGGFGDRQFLHEVLEETQRGIPIVQDMEKQRALAGHATQSFSSQQSTILSRGSRGGNGRGSCSRGRRGAFLLNLSGCM